MNSAVAGIAVIVGSILLAKDDPVVATALGLFGLAAYLVANRLLDRLVHLERRVGDLVHHLEAARLLSGSSAPRRGRSEDSRARSTSSDPGAR